MVSPGTHFITLDDAMVLMSLEGNEQQDEIPPPEKDINVLLAIHVDKVYDWNL